MSEVDDVDGIDSASTIEVQSIKDQDVTDILDMIGTNFDFNKSEWFSLCILFLFR